MKQTGLKQSVSTLRLWAVGFAFVAGAFLSPLAVALQTAGMIRPGVWIAAVTAALSAFVAYVNQDVTLSKTDVADPAATIVPNEPVSAAHPGSEHG